MSIEKIDKLLLKISAYGLDSSDLKPLYDATYELLNKITEKERSTKNNPAVLHKQIELGCVSYKAKAFDENQSSQLSVKYIPVTFMFAEDGILHNIPMFIAEFNEEIVTDLVKTIISGITDGNISAALIGESVYKVTANIKISSKSTIYEFLVIR